MLLSGCGGDDGESSSDGGGPRTVAIEEFKYAPETVEVDAGASVVWNNRDSAPHTATAADDSQRATFDTQVVKKAAKSRAVTFDEPGRYAYICDLHPFMKGTVVVR